MTPEKPRRPIPWWWWVVGVDLFLVAITVIAPYFLDASRPVLQFMEHFKLTWEMTPAVWWSGISLAVLAALAYELHREHKDTHVWVPISCILLGLSLDEIGSFHERMGSWSNLAPYGLSILAILTYSLARLFRRPEGRTTAVWLTVGFAVLCSVALQEYLEEALAWPTWMWGIRDGLEEGSELLGMLLIGLGIMRLYRPGRQSFRHVIPKPQDFRHLTGLTMAGVILSGVLCLRVLPQLTDLDIRGNPGVWYPAVMNFLLFAASFWKSVNSTTPNRRAWRWIAAVFLLCSLGTMQRLFPWWAVKLSLYLSQLGVVGYVFAYARATLQRSSIAVLLLLAGLVVVDVVVKDTGWSFLLLSVFTCVTATVLFKSAVGESV